MKYIVMDWTQEDLFVKEFESEEEAVEYADLEFCRLTEHDKQNRNAFYVLESVAPDEEAADHFDGEIVKRYI